MAKRVLLLALTLMTVCVGCSPRKPAVQSWPVVSAIDVVFPSNESVYRQSYTNEAKMRQILNCLRTVGQQFTPPIDPETLPARSYSIHIHFDNGATRSYQIKSDRYIRTDYGPWQQADPERIGKLNEMLLTLPGDPVQ